MRQPFSDLKSMHGGLRISIIEGIFAQIHINLTAGMFLTSFALFIGLNNIGIGLLSAIPAFFTGFAFFSIYLIKILKSRRTLCVLLSGLGRGIFFIFGLLLILNLKIGHGLFFSLIIIHNIFMNLSGNAWLSWMSDLVPREIRGRYFGLRNTILNIVSMATNVIGGRILDFYKLLDAPGRGLGLLFTGASVSSTIAAGVLSKQPEPPIEKESPQFKKIFLTPLEDKNFLSLLKFISFWYLLAGIASPFYLVHMLTNLQMSYSTIAFYSILAGVASLLFQVLWGKAVDRFKSKPVLTINFFFAAFLPTIWIFARKDFLLPIWIDAFLTGVFWSGINISLFNIIFSLTEEAKMKEGYFAVFSTVSGIFGFIASTLGGFIAQTLSPIKIHFIGFTLINYHLMFIFATIARLISLIFLARVKEKEAYPAIEALQLMGDYALRRVVLYKDLILNTLRVQK
ncbi:MAG: MFS transporter [candidate division WOR-3 bacterium]